MKRFITWALLTAALLVTGAGLAQARWSDPQDIPWFHQRSYNWGYGASYYLANGPRPDTLWTTVAASKVDTSAAFHLLDADIPGAAVWGLTATTSDSLPIAWVTVVGDSSAASTVNFKATTMAIQVNWGTNNNGWTTIQTFTSSQTDGTKFWNVPIYLNPSINDYGIDGNQLGWQFAPAVRVIVTGGSSASVPAARLRLVKWKDPASEHEGASTSY